MGKDHLQLCAALVTQKLGVDDAEAREILLAFDTNNDGVFQVDEFVDAVLGLGLDLSKAAFKSTPSADDLVAKAHAAGAPAPGAVVAVAAGEKCADEAVVLG